MLPRTFVRSDSSDVFVPRDLTTSKNGDTWCSCVYACEQFMTYPVDAWGRRIIMNGTPCPHAENGAPCTGELVWRNGGFSSAAHLTPLITYLGARVR